MRRFGRLVCLSVVLCTGRAPAAEPVAPERFDKLFALIRPTADESKWLQIPWRTDLTAARQEAAAAGKPLLLWEMDGHPLGCT
jgi:hypothetical protein